MLVRPRMQRPSRRRKRQLSPPRRLSRRWEARNRGAGVGLCTWEACISRQLVCNQYNQHMRRSSFSEPVWAIRASASPAWSPSVPCCCPEIFVQRPATRRRLCSVVDSVLSLLNAERIQLYNHYCGVDDLTLRFPKRSDLCHLPVNPMPESSNNGLQ